MFKPAIDTYAGMAESLLDKLNTDGPMTYEDARDHLRSMTTNALIAARAMAYAAHAGMIRINSTTVEAWK